MKRKAEWSLNIVLVSVAFAGGGTLLHAQEQPSIPVESGAGMAELEKHLDEMAGQIESMRQELVDSHREIQAMRAELKELRGEVGEINTVETDKAVAALQTSVERLRESSEVVSAEVKQHDQTKVETASKFPVRISGSVLFTAISNSGTTDNIDVPTVALAPQTNAPKGSLSATVRQTILSFDANGPHFGSARSSAALSVDFFGGAPYTYTTTAAGLLRLRTAHATLAWPNRSMTLAFDRPIVSLLEPTSWISVGQPPLAWSGNLWTWSPQLEFSQNLRRGWTAALALIDPAAPAAPSPTGLRAPDPAERTRQPGYEARMGNAMEMGGYTVQWDAGGYYSRQAYSYDRHLDAWAGTADWKIALASPLEISGAFYRGRGLGGLGGGAFKDYVPYDNYTELRGLDDVGGWGQAKWRFSPVLEANVSAGEDNAFAAELRSSDYAMGQNAYQRLARNLTAYGNVIYRPRTYLLFSGEYREIRSWPIAGAANNNHIVGLAAGYLF